MPVSVDSFVLTAGGVFHNWQKAGAKSHDWRCTAYHQCIFRLVILNFSGWIESRGEQEEGVQNFY